MNSYLKKVQEANRIMIRKLHEVCKKYDITYYCDAGFLLGAIRHKSFIPWDDDVDVAFTRKEIKKLLAVPREEWGDDFELVSFRELAPDGFWDFAVRLIYLKGRYPINSYERAEGFCKEEYRYKMAVDCFILDNAYDNVLRQKLLCLRLTFIYGKAMGHRKYINYAEYGLAKRIVVYLLAYIGKKESMESIYEQYERVSQSVKKETKHVFYSNYPINYIKFWLKKEWYDKVIPVQIDADWFDGPVNYHEILTVCYGDYMKLPPEEKRVPSHLIPEKEWNEQEKNAAD